MKNNNFLHIAKIKENKNIADYTINDKVIVVLCKVDQNLHSLLWPQALHFRAEQLHTAEQPEKPDCSNLGVEAYV